MSETRAKLHQRQGPERSATADEYTITGGCIRQRRRIGNLERVWKGRDRRRVAIQCEADEIRYHIYIHVQPTTLKERWKW
jgi:hypothetical protein